MAEEKNATEWPLHKREWRIFIQEIKDYPDFYSQFGNLSENEARRVWALIEEKLFPAYKCFVRVWPEWFSSGIWNVPFPGSRYAGRMLNPESFGLSAELQDQLKLWQAEFDRHDPWGGEELNRETFEAEQQRLTRALKRDVGEDVYVECYELHEVLMDGTTRNWRLILGLPETPPKTAMELDKRNKD